MHDCKRYQEHLSDLTGSIDLAAASESGCSRCDAITANLAVSLAAMDAGIEAVLDRLENNGDFRRQEIALRNSLSSLPMPLLAMLATRKRTLSRSIWVLPAIASVALVIVAVIFRGPVPAPATTGPLGKPDERGTPLRHPERGSSEDVHNSAAPLRTFEKQARPSLHSGIGRLAPFETSHEEPQLPGIVPYDPGELARHFERAQNVLRSVRNASADEDPVGDLAYEKARARSLVQTNRSYCRYAEYTGDQPVAELLDGVETLLIDIANLPEHPAADELKGLQERIRRTEIVATLSLFGSAIAPKGTIAE